LKPDIGCPEIYEGRLAAMNNIEVMAAMAVFVLTWYGLTLIGRQVLKRYEKMRRV
jgi:hypothetical protein